MGPNEHRIGGQLGGANHHSEQVPAHTELLAVDAGLCRHPDRTVVEHVDGGVQRQWVAGALDDDVGPQVDRVPAGGIRRTELTMTLISGNFST